MKKIIALFMLSLSLCFVSCTGDSTPTAFKAAVVNKAVAGGKLPQSPSADDVALYQALEDGGVAKVTVTKSTTAEDGSVSVEGSIEVEDADKFAGVFMALMFSGGVPKGQDVGATVGRTIASVEAELQAQKQRKKTAESNPFEATYTEKDGKVTLTKFKKVKAKKEAKK